jgi:hypothetical protein
MAAAHFCVECGAQLAGFATCQDDFHELLFWENENPEHGAVHHLLVLCYHLQHPGLYSPKGLEQALHLLVDFLENGLTPEEARRRRQEQVDSSRRTWKLTARPGWQAAYLHPIAWRKRTADIVRAGPDQYPANVRSWAASILADLRASGNLPPASDGPVTVARRAS